MGRDVTVALGSSCIRAGQPSGVSVGTGGSMKTLLKQTCRTLSFTNGFRCGRSLLQETHARF